MTTKTIYIADDGTVFNDKQECEKYEKNEEIPENVLNALKTLKTFCSKETCPVCPLEDFCQNEFWTWEVGDN